MPKGGGLKVEWEGGERSAQQSSGGDGQRTTFGKGQVAQTASLRAGTVSLQGRLSPELLLDGHLWIGPTSSQGGIPTLKQGTATSPPGLCMDPKPPPGHDPAALPHSHPKSPSAFGGSLVAHAKATTQRGHQRTAGWQQKPVVWVGAREILQPCSEIRLKGQNRMGTGLLPTSPRMWQRSFLRVSCFLQGEGLGGQSRECCRTVGRLCGRWGGEGTKAQC